MEISSATDNDDTHILNNATNASENNCEIKIRILEQGGRVSTEYAENNSAVNFAKGSPPTPWGPVCGSLVYLPPIILPPRRAETGIYPRFTPLPLGTRTMDPQMDPSLYGSK